jgi:hypothetical protein
MTGCLPQTAIVVALNYAIEWVLLHNDPSPFRMKANGRMRVVTMELAL